MVLQIIGSYIISRLVRIEYRAMELQLIASFVVLFVAVGDGAGGAVVAR